MEFQTWFLAILDLKFSQQEATIRGLLEPKGRPAPLLPPPRGVSFRQGSFTKSPGSPGSPISPRSPTSIRPAMSPQANLQQVFEVKLDQELELPENEEASCEDAEKNSEHAAESTSGSPRASCLQWLACPCHGKEYFLSLV